MNERLQRTIERCRDGKSREYRREDEGHKLANAITIILAREQKAEEQRHLRRLQVYKNICLLIAAVVIIGIHTGNDVRHAFANTFQISVDRMKENRIVQEADKTDREAEERGDIASRPGPRYTSIQVENGDSLWSIASRYANKSPMDIRRYVEELKRINQLTGDTIHAGNYLMVVYYQ